MICKLYEQLYFHDCWKTVKQRAVSASTKIYIKSKHWVKSNICPWSNTYFKIGMSSKQSQHILQHWMLQISLLRGSSRQLNLTKWKKQQTMPLTMQHHQLRQMWASALVCILSSTTRESVAARTAAKESEGAMDAPCKFRSLLQASTILRPPLSPKCLVPRKWHWQKATRDRRPWGE